MQPKLKAMNLWSLPLSLPSQTWVPLGLSALAPLMLMAVLLPLSRRRGRGIATVFALRIAVVLGFGFATLATVATVAVVRTGLTELHRRRAIDVRALAQTIERSRFGPSGAEALLQLGLFRSKDASVGFVAIGDDGCRSVCVLSSPDDAPHQLSLRRRLKSALPNPDDNGYIVSVGGRPYLVVASAVRDPAGRRAATVVAGFDAAYLADQATRAAWTVVTISYILLVIVGWNAWRQVHDSLATRIRAITMQLRLGIADDTTPTLSADGHELKDLADSVSSYIRQTLDQQQSNEERYRRLIELAPDGVLICSDAGVRFANPAAIALAGVKRRLDLIGLPIDRFLEFENVEHTGTHPIDGGLRPALWRRISGEQLHVEVAEVSYMDSGVQIRQYVVRDVTSRRAREAALAHRAEHDSLTGLVNRARFQARLAEMLSPRNAPVDPSEVRKAAVLFIDLDGFKPINDRAGHAAGDAVLVAVAARLRESTRGTDLVARFGGDEFAVLIEVREPTEVLTVAKRILRSLRQPIRYESNLLSVRASIGIANSTEGPQFGESGEPISGVSAAADLLRAADIAMYVAKTNGGDRYAHAGEWTESPDEDSDVNFHAVA